MGQNYGTVMALIPFFIFVFPIRHYKKLILLMCFIVPTVVPWYFWGETLYTAFYVPCILRYALVLNATWLVNSAAHMYGNRPYDKSINPRENRFVALGAIGTFSISIRHCIFYQQCLNVIK